MELDKKAKHLLLGETCSNCFKGGMSRTAEHENEIYVRCYDGDIMMRVDPNWRCDNWEKNTWKDMMHSSTTTIGP